MKQLIIITILFIIITACTLTTFLPSAHAQLAPATNSTAAARAAENVKVSGFQNRTYPIVNDPAEMEIRLNDGATPGYWTFHVSFTGVSGDATGITSKQDVSDFILGGTSFILFDHNFTAPGSYSVAIDEVSLGTMNVKDPRPQVTLSYVDFSPEEFFGVGSITMRVGPIRSNQTGEYRAIAVITPRLEGVEPFYQSYASYSKDSNWFTFNFELKEVGNYTITVWQGGVKQLTRVISVYPPTSTGGGPANPDTSVEAARTAAQAAGTVPMPPIIQIIGVDIPPSVYTYFPNVNATVNVVVTVKVLIPLNATISYPISVNGIETKVIFPVTISSSVCEGDEKPFSGTISLSGGREVILNPFATPFTHVNYVIGVGGVERSISVYAYPDYSYLFAGLGVLVVLASVVVLLRARRRPAQVGVIEQG